MAPPFGKQEMGGGANDAEAARGGIPHPLASELHQNIMNIESATSQILKLHHLFGSTHYK
ncbi:hypothetical protein Hanom_Chr00s142879g01819471 [Helianthus anomalus]